MTEAWLVVTVVELGILLSMPFLAPGVSPWLGGLLNIAMLMSICAPIIYWRFAAVFNEFESQPLGLARARHIKPRQAVTLAVATQIIGLLLTAGGVWWQNQKLEKFSQDEFDRAAERTQFEIVRRLNQPLYGLQGARAAMAAHPNFKRQDFRAYVAARNLPAEFPGIRGFGFMQRVPRDQLRAFIDAERADNAPEFSVLTAGSAPDLFVIKYIEPLATNRAALGLDAGQEAVRREAIERAVDTGEPALSGRILLVQDQNQTPGFLYFVPVYQKNSRPQTAAERRRDLVGLLYAPIVAAELFRGTTGISDQLVDFTLYERGLGQPEHLIFNSNQRGPTNGVAQVATATSISKHSDLRSLRVGGYPLSIRFSSSPIFDAAQDRSSLTFMGVGGVLLSLLVALTVWLLAVGRQRAQSQAQTMTAELNRMAQVVQHTDSAVSIMDRQRHIVWINHGFTQTTGYTFADAQGKTADELLNSGKSAPAAIETLLCSLDSVAPCRVELINRGKDGREYWADVELQPLFDEAKQWVGFMEIGQDITQQKQIQQRLEATMRDADALLSTLKTHAIVSETDRFGILTSVNAAFSQISGYSPEELIGRNHSIVQSGAHSSEFWADFWQTIRSGKPWRGEICNRRKDGTLYWVDSMIAPYVGGTGEIDRYVSIRTDITDRKQYECSLLEARTVAEQATQTKGQFLANMSHELRTPMNAILGMLKLLGHTPLSSNQLDYVNKTEGAAKSLLGLLNDILDFSKIEAGKMELDPQPFQVDRLMRDLGVVLSANVGAKNIEVLYDLDPALPPWLLGDAMRLQQVLINLAGNAVKFTTAGQVVISITREAAAPDTPEVPQIVFAVQDSGIGIAPENQAKIFTGFSQAEASTSRRFGGTGLGLAISQRLVALMGGRVELASALGLGSTFSFKLSLPEVTPAPEADEWPAPKAAPDALSVLVIDDNAVSRALLAKHLGSFGWQVAVARNGQEGLDLIQSSARNGVFPYQCIYVDWQMPLMDGWETVRRVRALGHTLTGPEPRIVMLSANTRDNLAQRTLTEQDQICAFLVKPVTASMLMDAALIPLAERGVVRLAPSSSQRQLEGLRVLVVEDNMINQQVAEELLSIQGALVSIASDGRQGVNAVASATRQFDVVLMDVQMPVMDGYKATQTIRQKLGLTRLPIIGLTANAMAVDRDACLQAGMNEHVGKPFNMAQLTALILKLTAAQAEHAEPGADASP